jgi:hypothetical protein
MNRICFWILLTLPFSPAYAFSNSCTLPFDSNSELNDILNIVNETNCSVIFNAKLNSAPSNISSLWAQEQTGSYNVRNYIQEKQLVVDPNIVSIVDGFQHHEELVKNLIYSNQSTAIFPGQAARSYFSDSSEDAVTLSEHSRMIGGVLGKNLVSPVTNSSTHWALGMKDQFKKLHDKGSVIVTIAGNFGGEWDGGKGICSVAQDQIDASKEYGAILVGSRSVLGGVSEYSDDDRELSILAPSTHEILSLSQLPTYRSELNPKTGFFETVSTPSPPDGHFIKFGGTSAAAPQVSGAIGAFILIGNYQPTSEEAKKLLTTTALRNGMATGNQFGIGTLNAFKIAKVAERIKEKCRALKNYSLCFSNELKISSNYEFKGITVQHSDLSNAFPDCTGEKNPKVSPNCSEMKNVLERIQESSFLDPENIENWKLLSCIYKSNGYKKNSDYYEMMKIWYSKKRLSEGDNILIKGMLKDDKLLEDTGIIEFLSSMDKRAHPFLKDILKNGSTKAKAQLAKHIWRNDDLSDSFLNQLSTDPEPMVRKRLAEARFKRRLPKDLKELQSMINVEKDVVLKEKFIELNSRVVK